jgi:hypothetical protein
MSDAKIVLERFNNFKFVFELLLIVLFFTLTFFGVTFVVPADNIMAILVNASATLLTFMFALGCLKLAERVTGFVSLKLEEAVALEKNLIENVKETKVASVAANRVIKTTKVVLKSPAAAAAASAAKRGRPKKEG